MATIIKHRRVEPANWLTLKAEADGREPAVLTGGDVIAPLALWLAHREIILRRAGRVGLLLAGHDDPTPVVADLSRFAVIAVEFPSFSDGRGFSLGRLLRERYGYKGELRAVGDIIRDQLLLLQRCGFDAFALRADQDPAKAVAAFDEFSETYQASIEQPLPLFRRRFA